MHITRDVNYHALIHGRTADVDLVQAQLDFGSTLPWLQSILEEVQGLRNAYVEIQAMRGDDLEQITALVHTRDRVRYLERLLDKIGAAYDQTTPEEKDAGPQDAVPQPHHFHPLDNVNQETAPSRVQTPGSDTPKYAG